MWGSGYALLSVMVACWKSDRSWKNPGLLDRGKKKKKMNIKGYMFDYLHVSNLWENPHHKCHSLFMQCHAYEQVHLSQDIHTQNLKLWDIQQLLSLCLSSINIKPQIHHDCTATPFGLFSFLIFSEQSVPLNYSFLVKWSHCFLVCGVCVKLYWQRCCARPW